MSAITAERSVAALQALGVHALAALIVVFGLSASFERAKQLPPPLLEVSIVDVSALVDAGKKRQQAALEQQRKAAAERQRQEQAVQREREAEARRQQQREATIERRRQEDSARQAELERQRKLQQEREKQLAAVRDERLVAERERKREEQRLAQLDDQQRQKDVERQQRLEQERLKQLIAMETQAQAEAQRLTLEQEWQAVISAIIQQNWRYPPTAVKGQRCLVRVNQIPGGAVNAVQVLSGCTWDESTQRSMEAAVLRSSPLPYQGYERVFRRQITFDFVIPD